MSHKCNACDKNCFDKKTKSSLYGMTIIVNNVKINDLKFYKKQLGKYKLNKTYRLCFECLYKAMGFKP